LSDPPVVLWAGVFAVFGFGMRALVVPELSEELVSLPSVLESDEVELRLFMLFLWLELFLPTTSIFLALFEDAS